MGDEQKPVKTVVMQRDIETGLRSVGMREGDVVLVHSSLSSFGYVQGGADAVVDALLSVAGPAGTVVVPTFTWDSMHDAHGAEFDMAKTPSETGRICEALRLRTEAVRSPHICHSVAAIGRQASELTRDSASAYGPESVFEALIRLDAWCLFLGVTFECCTALHAVEEYERVPYRQYRDFRDCTVVWPDGRRTPSNAVEFLRKDGYWNDFSPVRELLDRQGVLHVATVGAARITNVRIRDIIRLVTQRVHEDPGYLLAAECRPLLRNESKKGNA